MRGAFYLGTESLAQVSDAIFVFEGVIKMDALSRDQFHTMAARGALVPVYRELPADFDTPGSVYVKLRGHGPSFLLESVEKAEQVGRYSFLGFNPRRQLIFRGHEVTMLENGTSETRRLATGEDPLHVVAEELRRYQPVAPVHELVHDLPRFFGGAVGYMGYDLVRFFERLPDTARDGLDMPDLHLLVTDTLVVFDHVRQRLLVFANAHVPPGSDLDAAYDDAVARLDAIEARLRGPLPPLPAPPGASGSDLTSNVPQEAFEAAVRRAKEFIAAGDIFQVVAGSVGAPAGTHSRGAPHRRDAAARQRRGCGPDPRSRAAGGSQRARRARDARGPGPQ
jgi:anthranilate synthase component 1